MNSNRRTNMLTEGKIVVKSRRKNKGDLYKIWWVEKTAEGKAFFLRKLLGPDLMDEAKVIRKSTLLSEYTLSEIQ